MVSFDLNYSCRVADPKPEWMSSERLDYCAPMTDKKNGLEEIQNFFRELFKDLK